MSVQCLLPDSEWGVLPSSLPWTRECTELPNALPELLALLLGRRDLTRLGLGWKLLALLLVLPLVAESVLVLLWMELEGLAMVVVAAVGGASSAAESS